MELIRKAVEMHDAGTLSDDEFAAVQSMLLSGKPLGGVLDPSR